MQTNLIKIEQATIGGESQQGVNARDLHAFLSVKSRFNDWISNRIRDFGFVENQDYLTLTKKLVNGGIAKEYLLTLNMAKELSMVERNEKGKQARLYFIQCEKIAKNPVEALLAKSKGELLAMAAEIQKRNELLEKEAKENAPKVAFAEDVVASDNEASITATAKVLGIAPRKFSDWLRVNEYLYMHANQATQKSISQGLMVVRFAHCNGGMEKPYPHITGKGLYYFYNKLLKLGMIQPNANLKF